MLKIISRIISYLINTETLKRVDYFASIKSTNDTKIPLTKKDIIPIILAFLLILLFVYAVILIVSGLGALYHRISVR
jgi:hypothetical protein